MKRRGSPRGRSDSRAVAQPSSRPRRSPPSTTDGHRVEVVANIGDLADARQVAAARRRRRRPAAHRVPVLQPPGTADEDEQARIYEDIARALGPERTPRHPHARRRRRQAASLPADGAGGEPVPRRARDPDAAEPPRRAAHAVARDPARLGRRPDLRHVSDDRDAGGVACRARAFTRRRGRRLARPHPGRHHGRDAGGRAARGSVRARGGLLLDRHERPHAVHAGDGSHQSAARAGPRRTSSGGACDSSTRR